MRNATRILLVTTLFTLLTEHASAALSLESCRAGYSALRNLIRNESRAKPSGPEVLQPEVRRWLTTQNKALATTVMTQNLGDVVLVGKIEVRVVAKLGHGAEGDVYLVETPQGLKSLKTFFAPGRMEPHLRELNSDFPLPSPKVFERDEKTGRVLMEYIEGASVDHISGRWAEMGLTEKRKNEIMLQWDREIARIRAAGKWPPDGYNVIYSFHDQKFYRVDPL